VCVAPQAGTHVLPRPRGGVVLRTRIVNMSASIPEERSSFGPFVVTSAHLS
jgi:hypothetical protein